MPQLQSGRHVAVGEPGLIEAITRGDENSALSAIMGSRLSIRSTRDLVALLPVVYFDESQGTPPDCPKYPSGLLVHEVLEGQSDWSDEEVAEFRSWIENHAGLQQWLADYLERLDDAIRNAWIWQSGDL
jgi:hypothetical protein